MARILVIDDVETTSEIFARLLALDGHETATAATGAAGIQAAVQAHFDLILCDLRLPDISGIEVISKLKSCGIATPVVILTRFPSLDSSFDAGVVGAAAYMCGIVLAEDLSAIVRQALNGGRSPRLLNPPQAPDWDVDSSRPVSLPRRDARLDVIIASIQSNPSIPAKQLACVVGMSESRLRQHFKITFGMTLGKFLAIQRLETAAHLLLTTSERVLDIGARVGLTDVHYFRRVFRARYEMAPGVYRAHFRRHLIDGALNKDSPSLNKNSPLSLARLQC